MLTVDPAGGNPAGVVIGAAHPSDREMHAVAAVVGYSEAAFLTPIGERAYHVRYFSPIVEAPFCDHATVAAVVLAERSGPDAFRFDTNSGRVAIDTGPASEGSKVPVVVIAAAMRFVVLVRLLGHRARPHAAGFAS